MRVYDGTYGCFSLKFIINLRQHPAQIDILDKAIPCFTSNPKQSIEIAITVPPPPKPPMFVNQSKRMTIKNPIYSS